MYAQIYYVHFRFSITAAFTVQGIVLLSGCCSNLTQRCLQLKLSRKQLLFIITRRVKEKEEQLLIKSMLDLSGKEGRK